MINIMFVCHGNICRSTMAEFVFKDLVAKQGIAESFFIHSTGTSTEELGSPVHHGTRKKLASLGISCSGKTARQVTAKDCQTADYILVMDSNNLRNIKRFTDSQTSQKVQRLLDLTDSKGDIADPWYTGNFDLTYDHILLGCNALLEDIKQRGLL